MSYSSGGWEVQDESVNIWCLVRAYFVLSRCLLTVTVRGGKGLENLPHS